MLASITNFVLFLVFGYLVIYSIYLLTVNAKALFFSKKYIEQNSPANMDICKIRAHKICVIIFANSKTRNLEPLLTSLNEQTYDRRLYSTHVVFAKDSNSLLYTPDCMAGAQIHCIENPDFFSKDKALNIFIEKLLIDQKFDTYVFLGADRCVLSDYLEKVNLSLNKEHKGVITGKTTVIPEFKNHMLRARVMDAIQEYKNNTVYLAREMYDLAAVIDSENCVFTADILEKTGRICFETKEDELKYSLFLASNNIKPVYSPFMETIIEAENFNPTTSGFNVRFALFRYYTKLLCNKPWYFVEFVLSLMQPNVAVLLLLYFTVFYTSFKFISSIGIKYVFHLGIFYSLILLIGLIAARMSLFKIIMLGFYPIYSFAFNFKKITKEIAKKALARTISEEKNIKSATMDASVTDGKKDVLCKMDLISEDGMRRVILRFRKKRIISDESIRMYDAVQNISKKLKTRNLALKICQNCIYYKPTPDGTVDLLRGKCRYRAKSKNDEQNLIDMLIWNSCNCFKQGDNKGLIDNINKNKG